MAAQPGLVNAPRTSRLLTTTSAEPGNCSLKLIFFARRLASESMN